VLVYYADRKALTKEVLEGVDVVLTTYPVVEGEWRKVINKTMVECQYGQLNVARQVIHTIFLTLGHRQRHRPASHRCRHLSTLRMKSASETPFNYDGDRKLLFDHSTN